MDSFPNISSFLRNEKVEPANVSNSSSFFSSRSSGSNLPHTSPPIHHQGLRNSRIAKTIPPKIVPDSSRPSTHNLNTGAHLIGADTRIQQPPSNPAASLPTPRPSLETTKPLITQASRNTLEVLTDSPSGPSGPAPELPPPIVLTPPASPDDAFVIPAQVDLPKLLVFLTLKAEHSLLIPGIDNKSLGQLESMALAGKLPGWESAVRYVGLQVQDICCYTYPLNSRSFVNGGLFLEFPSTMHEILPDIFTRLSDQGKTLPSNGSKSVLRVMGSSDIPLEKGIKSPDYSIFEVQNSSGDSSSQGDPPGHPTVAFEVGYSQDIHALRYAAARTLGGALGAVNLVVIIKLSYEVFKGERQEIQTASAEFWEVEYEREVEHWEKDLNTPILQNIDASDVKYLYVSKGETARFSQYFIGMTQIHQASTPVYSVSS